MFGGYGMKYLLKVVNSQFELEMFLNICNKNNYKIQFMTQNEKAITIIYTI